MSSASDIAENLREAICEAGEGSGLFEIGADTAFAIVRDLGAVGPLLACYFRCRPRASWPGFLLAAHLARILGTQPIARIIGSKSKVLRIFAKILNTNMGAVAEKEQLVRNVVRLRRAERMSSACDEIAEVRTDLERMAGSTVGRAMAARLLGVSQTALDRWIALGDVPVVVARTGRREVPLRALVELVLAVKDRKDAGRSRGRHPLAWVLRERRAEAERLDMRRVLPGRGRVRDHGAAELYGLAFHRAVAQRLDEQLVRDARARIHGWRSEGRIDPRYADAWEQILALPLPRIAVLVGQDTERARDLRQSSPFAGALSEPERQRVLAVVGEALR